MERLKAELLMIGKDRGDTASTEIQRQWIGYYLASLEKYLTPEGIKAFTAEDLRIPYVEYMKTVAVTGSVLEAEEQLIGFFHTRPFTRDKPLEVSVSSGSVVDIFSRRP